MRMLRGDKPLLNAIVVLFNNDYVKEIGNKHQTLVIGKYVSCLEAVFSYWLIRSSLFDSSLLWKLSQVFYKT